MTLLPRLLLPALALGLLAGPGFAQNSKKERAAARATAAAPANTVNALTAFRPIAELNIFDSTRIDRSHLPASGNSSAPATQFITLVGTMNYTKGLFAFFDSSDPALRRVIPAGTTLGDFQLTKIEPSAVEFTRDGKLIRLQVAQQLRRPEGADWTVADAPLPPPPSAAAAEDATRPAPSIPANASEALLRLMEKRKQQLQKP